MRELGDVQLVIAFFGFHSKKVRGRTRIQKELCILKYSNVVQFDFSFMPHFYGPYSSKLSDIIETLVSTSFLEESITRSGLGIYRYDYSLTEKGRKTFQLIKGRLARAHPEMLSKLESRIHEFEAKSTAEIVSLAKDCSGMMSLLKC